MPFRQTIIDYSGSRIPLRNDDRYTIVREIASGSTATVFLAEDKVLRRKVALKKLHPHLTSHYETVKRFEKEAVSVASLSHENIIKIFDFGNEDKNLFLAMEYVDGFSLEALLNGENFSLPNLVALDIFQQILKGLTAAHDVGICHRDIKPSNILVDKKGLVRIADFGIAYLAEENSITKTGSFLGTPRYSAPEQAQGKTVTAKSDIFSTGILFYRCLTGKLPFEGETSHTVLKCIIEKPPPKLLQINRRILPGLPELVEKMLTKIPERRPDARHCLVELSTFAEIQGFNYSEDRLRRYLLDPAGYKEEERTEISAHFIRQARTFKENGDSRQALKLLSQAEIFEDLDAAGKRESQMLMLKQNSKYRKLALFCTFLAFSVIVVFWIARQPSEIQTHRKEAQTYVNILIDSNSLRETMPSVWPESTKAFKAAADSKVFPKPIHPSSLKHSAQSQNLTKPAETQTTQALITPQFPTVQENVTATQLPGYLMIKTSPPFAMILVDGDTLGTTPLKSAFELPAGNHELTLQKEGCFPVTSQIIILSGETALLRFELARQIMVSQ